MFAWNGTNGTWNGTNGTDYVNFFRTGDQLALTKIFNYEEKGRSNVQGDNYESSELSTGGPAFSMAEQVCAVFHGDPWIITETTYTYGQGFLNTHRRFAQAYLSLPAIKGTVVKYDNPDVKIRIYPSNNGTYVGVVHKGMQPAKFAVSFPGTWKGPEKVTDLVTGIIVQAQIKDGNLEFNVNADPMQMHSYLIK